MSASPRENHLRVQRTARYHELGGEGTDLDELWYVVHGYGQLSAEFLPLFAPIATPRRRLVAPEGLSRYYRDGSSGTVGASWMTREARDSEVEDYVSYLDALHAKVAAELTGTPRITVLGFSQGAATVGRWVGMGAVRPERLLIWGGLLPHDLDLAACRGRLAECGLAYIVGERDHWVTPERLAAERARVEEAGLEFRLTTFAGGHRLDDGTLEGVAEDAQA
ncbi:MAG: hypothetical protein AAF682_07100 [Planctomycetota bacterium]